MIGCGEDLPQSAGIEGLRFCFVAACGLKCYTAHMGLVKMRHRKHEYGSRPCRSNAIVASEGINIMDYNIDSLESVDNPFVLFRGVVGSRAYGTHNANSDTDVRGIFVVPSAEYARLAQPPNRGDRPRETVAKEAFAQGGGWWEVVADSSLVCSAGI